MDLDNLADACLLPKYPASKGPVTMAFYDSSGVVVACGEEGNIEYKECSRFDGITWEPLPSLLEVHKPSAYFSRSHSMEGGLWLGGSDGFYGMANEIFNAKGHGEWNILTMYSPYQNIDYPYPCSVALNSTHIFLNGGSDNGDYRDDTWVFDLENMVWTPSTPMLTSRYRHGCALTDDGEVIVAGGYTGSGSSSSSVHIFNPVSMEWRTHVNLPSEIDTDAPGLLLWNANIILIEKYTDHIWLMGEDQEWQIMDAEMGTSFDGRYDNAVLVPKCWREGCT